MEETTTSAVSRFGGFVGKIGYWVLAGAVFLLPFFFIPTNVVPVQLAKGLLLLAAVIIAVVFYIVSVIKEGNITVPKNLFFLSVLIIPLVALVSAIVNGSSTFQFIGYSFDTGSVAFIFLAAVLIFLVSETFKKTQDIFYSYLGFFVSFAVVALFQIIRLIGGAGVLSFGLFTDSSSSIVGSWNDMGIFFALATILSLVTLEMLTLSKQLKWLLSAVFVISLFFLTLINFSTLWIVLGVFALVFFIYLSSFEKFARGRQINIKPQSEFSDPSAPQAVTASRKISYYSLAVIVLAVLFMIGGAGLGQWVSNTFHVSNVEVRPSWVSTMSILSSTMKNHAVVGSGPDTFTNMWVMYKPTGVNETPFWNTDFSTGIGLIPTYFVAFGVLGILSWIFFFVMFVWVGIRAIFYSLSDLFSRYLVTSSFLVALFLWIMSVVYVPSVAIVGLTFFFTGLFIAVLNKEGILKTKTLSLSNHPKLSFVSVLLLVVLLIATISLGYVITVRSLSMVDFQKSLAVYADKQDANQAEAYMNSAIALSPYDAYYRGLVQIDLIKINTLLSAPGTPTDAVKTQFQTLVADAINNAKTATTIDPTNYQNFLTLAQVYAALVPPPFSITGAYDMALANYQTSLKISPTNPNIPLLMARLEVAHNDLEKARGYANQAIALKQSFADAHFLIAQIEATEGHIAAAIPPLQATLQLSPNNPGLFFQLGLLQYDQKDWNGAISSFSSAITQVPNYANAKYFLGLAYQKVGNTAGAIAQFQDLVASNPDNQDVKNVLANLRAGKDPFANVPPPKNQPQNGKTPPITQGN
jgi:tetratricopeptide (TPR) repeat protein